MRLAVLRLRPIDDPLSGVPLVNMERSDLLDTLARQHKNANSTGVRRMHWRVRTFKPAIESDEVIFIEPARADDLRLSRDAIGGVSRQLEAARRIAAIVVFRLETPGISGSDVAANVVCHRSLPTVVYWTEYAKHIVGGNVASEPVAPDNVGSLFQVRLRIPPRRLAGALEVLDISLKQIRDALDRIAIGTERLVQGRGSGVLTVSTSPDFAAKWLVNRLGRFAESHPEIDLRVSATMHQVDFVREDVDLAVRHGDGKWPGLDVVRLCSERLFPVCSPKLLSGRHPITTASDLLRFPLLRLDDWTTWTRWFKAAGVANPVVRGPTLNRASMLIDAAVDGQGIALARTALAAWDMLNGRLVKPIDVCLRMPNTYWIVCPKAASNAAKIEAVRTWLLDEAAADAGRLRTLAR